MHKASARQTLLISSYLKTSENVNKYLSKGSLAGVDGRLQTRNYENKEGQRVYVTEVMLIVFNFRTENSNDTQQDLYQQQVQQTRGQSQYSNNKPVKDNPFANANGPVN